MDKEELLKRTLEDLGKQYPIGLYEFLYECHREAYNEILQVEDRIDQTFLTGTVEGLKAVLRDYWKIHMQAIKEFQSRGQLTFNLQVAKKEMEEKRINA